MHVFGRFLDSSVNPPTYDCFRIFHIPNTCCISNHALWENLSLTYVVICTRSIKQVFKGYCMDHCSVFMCSNISSKLLSLSQCTPVQSGPTLYACLNHSCTFYHASILSHYSIRIYINTRPPVKTSVIPLCVYILLIY